MSLIGFTIIIGLLVFAGLSGVIYALSGRQSGLKRRLGATKPEEAGSSSWRNLLKGSQRVFKPLGDMIPRSPEEMSRQQKRLVMAGIRHKDGPVLFYGVKIGLAITLLVVFSAMGMIKWNPLLAVSLPVLSGALIPDVWLARKSRNRKERIQLAIPDVLDLTVVCVEAGLGLDQALMRIGQEVRTGHPDLSEELRLYNLEVNAGRNRADALRNLGGRTDVEDLRSLTAVLIQTDRFGTSIAQSLRVFSESLRTKRRQRAEERAAKTTVKMVPVLVFFIFPSIFIVVLFPAVLAIIRDLFPAIGGK
jgi:tight adherence protein C